MQWREYMDSKEYKEECERARPNRSDPKKQREVVAKVKVCSLRDQRRRCRNIMKKLKEGTLTAVPYYQKDLYDRFLDGSLDKQIDEATVIHGYGTLSTGQQIGAFGPKFH